MATKTTARRQLRGEISTALRQHGAGSTRLAQAFAVARGMRQSDLQALVAAIAAADSGQPLTVARLREQIGLSSAGTTYVVDRLESAGFVRRRQDDPTDRRAVRVQPTDEGIATVAAFFGPLSKRIEVTTREFDDDELRTIARFLGLVADVMREQVRTIDSNRSADG